MDRVSHDENEMLNSRDLQTTVLSLLYHLQETAVSHENEHFHACFDHVLRTHCHSSDALHSWFADRRTMGVWSSCLRHPRVLISSFHMDITTSANFDGHKSVFSSQPLDHLQEVVYSQWIIWDDYGYLVICNHIADLHRSKQLKDLSILFNELPLFCFL